MEVNSAYVPVEPGADLAQVDMCTLEMKMKYEVISSIVCSICLSLGLIYCFLGYRCFRVVMFVSGFMFGTTALLLLHRGEPGLEVQLGTEAAAGVGLAAGALCGLMTMLVSTLGLLLGGLQLGTLLSLFVLVVIAQFHSPTPAWAPLAAALAVSLLAAAATLKWQKLFSVLYTSVFGATTVTLCVDYLLGTFVLPDQVYDLLWQVAPNPMCWFNWAIIGIGPALSVLGALVQWRFTAKGVSHLDGFFPVIHKKHRKLTKMHGYRESSRRPSSQRRRRPPPLKRYAGDVLAPSYIQILQERRMGTGSSTSSGGFSTATHALIDFDFETGSMMPLTANSPVFTV